MIYRTIIYCSPAIQNKFTFLHLCIQIRIRNRDVNEKISLESPCLKGAGTVGAAPADQARHLLGYQAQFPATRLHSSSLSTGPNEKGWGLWTT
jgi:hypothetical protein